ncbi:zinc metalloprotease [Nocardioides pyridinolyticus]
MTKLVSVVPSLRSVLVAGALALTLGAAGPSPTATLTEVSDVARTRTAYPIAAVARVSDVPVDGTIRIVGSVETRAKPRKLLLEERVARAWVTIAAKSSSRTGAYTFRVPAGGEPGVRTFRVRALRSQGLRAGVTAPIAVDVVAGPTDPDPPTDPGTDEYDAAELLPEGYVGAGTPGSWSYLFPDGGRWNPCAVIRWAYNPAGQGYTALADVQRAFAKISGASGLKFRYTGATTWRFLGNVNDAGFPAATADIVVGWADDSELPSLGGNVVGVGGGRGWGVGGADVRWRMDRGYLTLDNGEVLPAGYDRSGWGQVMLHEILHALGLGHADESVQVMYGIAAPQNIRFGAGDLTGMSRTGAEAGCLP